MRQSYSQARAYAAGSDSHYTVTTEFTSEPSVIFQVSPDGVIRLIQVSPSIAVSQSRSVARG